MTELFKNIKPGQRCLFYALKPGEGSGVAMFRANVVQIINNTTLNANNIECKECCVYQTGGMLCMPLSWIVKIETLDDIVYEKILIPSEIMIDIDLYV